MKNLIIGYGITGKSVENYLQSIDTEYLIYDDDKKNLKDIDDSQIYRKKNIDSINEVIISPGIRPDHPIVQQLKSKSISIKTDIDIFSTNYKGKIIGVTGTNGKTTFVNEITKFLNLNNLSSIAVGNIGISPLDIKHNNYEYVILELSSYQLYYTTNLELDLAVILNIFPDHIDWHKSFDNYAISKKKILNFLQKDKIDRKIIGSNLGIIEQNLPVDLDLNIKNNIKVHKELLLALGEAAKIIGGEELYNNFIKYIKINNFDYPHRMEQFLKIENKNITFFDDSKATNYHAVNKATKLFSADEEDGILILHGITKETLNNKLDIDPFFKHVIIPRDMNVNLGIHNAEIIYIEHIYDLKDILEKLLIINQIVLFSCGGSSFNDFENYQVRGNYFKNTVFSMEIKDA